MKTEQTTTLSDHDDLTAAVEAAYSEVTGDTPRDHDPGMELDEAIAFAWKEQTGEDLARSRGPVVEDNEDLDAAVRRVYEHAVEDQTDREAAGKLAPEFGVSREQAEEAMRRGRAELREFAAARDPRTGELMNPHFDEVRDLVGQALDLAARQGRHLPLDQAYRAACLVSRIEWPHGRPSEGPYAAEGAPRPAPEPEDDSVEAVLRTTYDRAAQGRVELTDDEVRTARQRARLHDLPEDAMVRAAERVKALERLPHFAAVRQDMAAVANALASRGVPVDLDALYKEAVRVRGLDRGARR